MIKMNWVEMKMLTEDDLVELKTNVLSRWFVELVWSIKLSTI